MDEVKYDADGNAYVKKERADKEVKIWGYMWNSVWKEIQLTAFWLWKGIMERYNNKSDFDNFRDMMSKKSTRVLKKELEKIENKASVLRTREFNGFKMSTSVSSRIAIYSQ